MGDAFSVPFILSYLNLIFHLCDGYDRSTSLNRNEGYYLYYWSLKYDFIK